MSTAEFEGMSVIVTGGASGIGAATVQWFAARGARVASLDLQPQPEAAQVRGFACDVRDDASVQGAVSAAADWLGGIDVLVNNAGIASLGKLESQDDQEWQRVFDVNLFGLVRTTRAALPWLRRSERAAIVNNCSAVACMGLSQRTLYSASKGAILAFTRALAADCLQDSIRVNCVTPGVVDTPWQARAVASAPDPAARRAQLERLQPSGKLVKPEHVAAAIAYLASPASGSTTGVDLPVDGGMQSIHLSALPAS